MEAGGVREGWRQGVRGEGRGLGRGGDTRAIELCPCVRVHEMDVCTDV